MKIRNGFVSNSSTTSFCVFGALLNKIPVNTDAASEVEDEWIMFELFEEKANEIGLSVHSMPEGDGIVVGVNATDLPMDKTLNEMKSIILAKMHSLGIKKGKIEWYEEAWRDG